MSTLRRVVALGFALLLVVSLFAPLLAQPARAADHSFVVEQGDQCIPVRPLSGSENVVNFYDYRNPHNTDGDGRYTYSSFMPSQLQRTETSRLLLYDGPNGVSLVILHNERGSDRGDSAASFRFSGMPASGEWVVTDDVYPGHTNHDRWNTDGETHAIDWTWHDDRTDGGAFRGLDRADLELTISPAFNENAELYDSPVQRDGRLRDWQVLSGDVNDPDVTSLSSMSDPISVRTGSCDDTPPSASLTASPTTAEAGTAVTFDASDSDDESGVQAYRWEFGDGATAETTDPVVEHTYRSVGEYEASVTAVDADENTGTATTTVTVTDQTPPNASATIPDAVAVGEELRVDGSDSSDNGAIASYEWEFGDGAHASGETASHAYAEGGTYDVTLTVTDSGGNRDTYSQPVTVSGATETEPPSDTETETETQTQTPTQTETQTETSTDTESQTETPTQTETQTETPRPTETETPEPTPEPTETEQSPSNRGGGGQSAGSQAYGSSTSSPNTDQSEMSLEVDRDLENSISVQVHNPNGEEEIRVEPLQGDHAGTTNAAYDELTATIDRADDFDLVLRSDNRAPDETPSLTVDEHGSDALSYLSVSHPDVADEEIDGANVTFSVSKQYLDDAERDPSDVLLYHHDGDEWVALDSTVVNETEDAYEYRAESPGLSVFAIAAAQPSIEVTDLELSDSTIASGESVGVTATIENDGLAAGQYTAELTVFDEVVDARTVTVPAGETVEVTFTQQVEATGRYEIAVGGVRTSFEAADPETVTPDPIENHAGQPGFGVFVVLVALLGGGAFLTRRG